jgi:hypothetical protein
MARLPLLEATVRSLMGRPSSPPASEDVWVYNRAPSEDGRSTSRVIRVRRQVLQPTPGLLTDAEIVRALRRFRYDPEFRGPKRVPIRVLAEMAGLSHATIYDAMRPDLPSRPRRISEATRIKLSFAIKAVNEGRLRFRRRGQVWDVEGAEMRVFEPRRHRKITESY